MPMTLKERRQQGEQFRDANATLAGCLAGIVGFDPNDKPLTVTASRMAWTVKPKNAEAYRKKLLSMRLLTSPPSGRQSTRRTFPKFEPGMSTRDYVTLFAIGNNVLWSPREYGQLNAQPAALYEGGALDFEPMVEAEAVAEVPAEDLVADLI